MSVSLKIGELARQSGCKVETIRYYEQQGLLPAPARTAGNYRVYGAAHRERLQFIRHCRALDMTLDEIGQLLALREAPDVDCDAVNVLLDQHIAQVSQRIAELQALQGHLQALRGSCRTVRPVRDCAILQGLAHSVDAK